MYDRAARFFTCTSSSTCPHVGPGTYIHYNSRSTRENYAPFHSMDARQSFLSIGESIAAAPGPGYYSHVINNAKIKGGTSIDDKSIRFLPVSSISPGPGSYSIPSKWIRKTSPAIDKITKRSPMFHRRGTAPSIPTFGQNYGYEEDNNGLLKPLECPDYDHTMGPAFYTVPSEDIAAGCQKYKGVGFGSLTSNRTVFKEPCDGPGPTTYTPMETAIKSSIVADAKQLNVPRYHESISKLEKAKGVPGPGQYDIKSQFNSVEVYNEDDDTTTNVVPFGSSMQRFVNKEVDTPACNLYYDPCIAFGNVQHQLVGTRRTPFSQSSRRFKTNTKAAHTPGPGAYDYSRNNSMMAEMLKRNTLGAACPFGSTTSRVLPLIKKDAFTMPSPAAYQDSDLPCFTKSKLSHTFSSDNKRFPLLQSMIKDTPSPAAYQVSKSFLKTQGKIDNNVGHTGFLSQADRFSAPCAILPDNTNQHYPGPGDYEIVIPHQTHTSGLLCSRDGRFKSSTSATPGPGAYTIPKVQAEAVSKGTFNITLKKPNPYRKCTTSPRKWRLLV